MPARLSNFGALTPADLTACYESMGGPNVCNDLAWSGSSGVTYNVYRSSTSPVPIDAGHRITSGLSETEYTDCGRSPGANDVV